jgi:hypothetical protein
MLSTLYRAASVLCLLLAGCASRQPAVWVGPRLDLMRYEAIGIVEFGGPAAAALGGAATDAFLGAVHAAQPGTPVLELGNGALALPAAQGHRPDAAAIRALAAREHVQALWIGELIETQEQPRLAINAEYGSASASARLKASVSVRLFDGATGATVWSAASERSIPLMSVDGTLRGLGRLHTTPLEEARTILVRDLVEDVTCDLRGHWQQP